MSTSFSTEFHNAMAFYWSNLASPSKILLIYSMGMLLALVATYLISLDEVRTIREVGIWIKPMKFMASTALFSLTTVWVVKITSSNVEHLEVFENISALIVLTSLFEVFYISYQAYRGEPSHYNIKDRFHSAMFMLMGLAAVGLVVSQAWLAWEIWKEQSPKGLSAVTLSVVLGLGLTFILSLLSGFFLGANQPPAGQGLPIVGWHLQKDIRPAHFLGVHAQQFIPLFGIMASHFLGKHAFNASIAYALIYTTLWSFLTWQSF